MKRLLELLTIGLLAFGVLVLAPTLGAAAQPEDEEGDEEESEDADEDSEDAEEEDTEEEEEVSEEEAASLFTADDEIPGDDEEEEEEVEGEYGKTHPLTGTYTKSIVFSSEGGWFKFQPRGWVQPLYNLHINPDGDDALAGSGFRLQRARFGFQAHLFEFARVYLDTGWSKGSASVVDFFIDINPFDGLVGLRVGYFRPWFARQLLMGTTQLQMVDYAKAWTDPSLGLGLGRDLGLGVFGMIADTVEYGLGVWNGGDGFRPYEPSVTENGMDAPANIDYMFGGRIAFHPLAPAGIGTTLPLGNESDTAISEKPALSLGFAMLYNKRHNRDILVGADYALYYDSQLKIGGDLGFKWKGFTLQGEFFMIKTSVQDDADPIIKDAVADYNDTIVENIDGVGIGAYGQLGYFVLPNQLEVAARFDMVDEDKDLRGMRFYPAAGVTYYIFGNNLKAQLMYRLNMGSGYEEASANAPQDPGYIPTTHDVLLMLQAAI